MELAPAFPRITMGRQAPRARDLARPKLLVEHDIFGKPICSFPDHVQAQKWRAQMRCASRVFRRLAQCSAAKLGTRLHPASLTQSPASRSLFRPYYRDIKTRMSRLSWFL